MLQRFIQEFLTYCRLADFSDRSIQALTARLNEFQSFLKVRNIRSVKKITYLDLVAFVADFNSPSIHVRKSRVWTLRQFYHFLTLNNKVAENIATRLPYPKIEKTVPQFLTQGEYNRLIRYFSTRVNDLWGLRNLIIVMLLGTLGLRTTTLRMIDVNDIDIRCGLLWVHEKGRRQRNMILPQPLCEIIHKYLKHPERKHAHGPLLISKRGKRISQRALQDIFRKAADKTRIDKTLHARLFRHTAATHLNRVSGIEITQHVLGHSHRANTLKYAHLNPDQYAVYMKRHPYMRKEAPCLH
ncbi:MAG: tyrosine-type recombinase/integrase [Proteobacteria bacterium]|nr:tyrosine-type recombinase/integrase [Pseudomonadota bacterium]